MAKKEPTRPRRTTVKKAVAEAPAPVSEPKKSEPVEAAAPVAPQPKAAPQPKQEPVIQKPTIQKRAARPSFVRWVLFIVAIVVILALGSSAVFAVGIYRLKWQGRIVDRVVAAVPYPVAIADKTMIPFHDYVEDMKTLNYYFDNSAKVTGQQQEKPSPNEIASTVINRLIYDSVVERLINQYHVEISDAELNDQLSAIAASGGDGTDVAALLKSLYGWDEAQFKQKVLRPYVALQKLDALLTSNGALNGDAEQRANDVLAKVKEGKTSFEDLAKQYSEDTTASVGGDLGFFGKGEMDPAFEAALDKLQPGEISGVVKTQFGYHIIKLVSKVDNGDKGVQYQASHILIRTKTIDDYVNDQLAQQHVRILLRGFSWDSENHWVVADGAASS